MTSKGYVLHLLIGTGFATQAKCARGRMSQRQLMGVAWNEREHVTCSKCAKHVVKMEAIKAKHNNGEGK